MSVSQSWIFIPVQELNLNATQTLEFPDRTGIKTSLLDLDSKLTDQTSIKTTRGAPTCQHVNNLGKPIKPRSHQPTPMQGVCYR